MICITDFLVGLKWGCPTFWALDEEIMTTRALLRTSVSLRVSELAESQSALDLIERKGNGISLI
jgi:hypothetical protein